MAEKIKIEFGKKPEAPEMEAPEGMAPEAHDAHMEAVTQGLQAILASEDINEIKQIAQSLLGEEEKEMAVEAPSREEQMNAAMGGMQE